MVINYGGNFNKLLKRVTNIARIVSRFELARFGKVSFKKRAKVNKKHIGLIITVLEKNTLKWVKKRSGINFR